MIRVAGHVLVTCSGVSNTGRLTAQASAAFMQRRPSALEACIGARDLEKKKICGDCTVVVLDGCTDGCGRKKCESLGISPDVHIIATELGIRKNGMAEVRFDEIETVVSALKNVV
ncbi:MAG: hypothetical protein PWP08_1621 [Methanofollis sp.]|nr:hypothetical protein [Methanofollis sp.]